MDLAHKRNVYEHCSTHGSQELLQPKSSVQERDPSVPALGKTRPALRVQTHLSLMDRCAQAEYSEMNPYARENEQDRVGVALV